MYSNASQFNYYPIIKVLKWQIENNDIFSIQLKLWSQIDVDVEIALEKVPINGEHVHVQMCNFKTLKELLTRPRYYRNPNLGLITKTRVCKGAS
jgi:hypothetical protein